MGLTQKLGTIPLAIQTDSSNNVGIGGAANASYKLAVTGASLFSSSITSNANEGIIINPSSGASYQNFRIGGTSYSLIGIAGATNDIISGSLLGDLNIRAANSQKILFSTNNGSSASMLINSSGKVGFGTTNPSSIIGLKATGADGLALEYDNSDSNNSTRIFFLSAVQNYGLFNNGGDLRLTFAATPGNTSGSSFARFTNTGRYFRMESGSGGIQFGGDTAAANALNDYEEGTWTPTITNGGWGVTALTARYTKVGRIVHCIADFNLTGSANSGVLTISGLPFVSLPTGYAANACYFNYINVDNRNLAVITLSSSSALTFEIVPNSSGVARGAIGTDFSAGYCNVNVTYFTS